MPKQNGVIWILVVLLGISVFWNLHSYSKIGRLARENQKLRAARDTLEAQHSRLEEWATTLQVSELVQGMQARRQPVNFKADSGFIRISQPDLNSPYCGNTQIGRFFLHQLEVEVIGSRNWFAGKVNDLTENSVIVIPVSGGLSRVTGVRLSYPLGDQTWEIPIKDY
jgi:hypothetical protein